MKHRYDKVKHFFADVFTDGQIERAFRYEPPCESDKTAADKAADIAEQYADLVLEPTTPRTDREVKREIRKVSDEIRSECGYEKLSGSGFVGEGHRISE
jgi:hypothetical protein